MQISEHHVQTLRHIEGQPLPRVTFGAALFTSSSISETPALETTPKRTQFTGLHLDISSILPEWKDPKILTGFDEKNEAQFRPAKRFITLRQLLTHSSGLAYPFMHPLCAKYNEIKKAPLIQQTVRAAFPAFLLFEPGKQWLYGPGLEWAGLMVEAVNGGMKLGEYMQKHIFDPLSITDFWTRVGPELQETEGFWPDPVEDDIGGGGIYTTVTELLRLYQGFLQRKLLGPETMAEFEKSVYAAISKS
ncbi:Acyltransferase mlcH [Colletotrichum trifolii]|uniref:Acyltransferase mlcH n=1 Tax=Colletotrichum trifolii TaxID=5466 RepID=A0A4R8RTX5_COLTR|nr:Acyltransferase mlcH [Colletotrichum trifolii]